MRARVLAHALLLLVMAALAPSCASVVPPDDAFASARCSVILDDNVAGAPTYDIGVIVERTDPNGKLDFDIGYDLRAMRLALQELNQNHDIANKRLRLRVCDTRADWSTGGGQVTRDLANWLIDTAHVQVLISDASADTETISGIAKARGILLMAMSATSEGLTYLADNDLVWRVAPSDLYQGVVLADLVSKTVDPGAKVAVFAMQSNYGAGLADALQRQLGSRAAIHTFALDGTGLDTAIQAAALEAPQALIFVANSPLVARLLNARAVTPALKDVPVFLADGACDSDLATQDLKPGVNLDKQICTRPGQPPTEYYTQFRERYKALFKDDPVQSSYTQFAYDAVYCVALAHAWATGSGGTGKTDGKSLAQGLMHLSKGEVHPFGPSEVPKMVGALSKGQDIDVQGASGALDFDPTTGEAPSDYEVWTLGAKGELLTRKYVQVHSLGPDVGGKPTYEVLPVDVTPP
jgi:branched-chain amino acid transport system substrate-binding protein